MTPAQRHMGRVAALGCIACANLAWGHVEAEVHHISDTANRSDYLTIPLCPSHHRTGGRGVAYHAGPRAWEPIHGTELQLLAQTIALLERP